MKKLIFVLVLMLFVSCKSTHDINVKYTEKGYEYHIKPLHYSGNENDI